MKTIKLHDPVIIAQSTTEPVFKGGYQDPLVRRAEDGTLYVRFNARRDCWETFGQEEANPVYKSTDGGDSWSYVENGQDEWLRAGTRLPNGDIFYFREHAILKQDTLPELPPLPEGRTLNWDQRGAYLVDELEGVLGDRVAREFKAYRIKAGTDEIIEETCPVIWKNMPVFLHKEGFLSRIFPHPGLTMKVDRDGVLWMPVTAMAVADDGTLASPRLTMAIFRSTDMGHTWEHFSDILYEEDFNPPTAIDVEGFLECAIEFVEDGSCIAILRSGSLSPFEIGDDEHPAPVMMRARSIDGCRTWSKPEKFYDYGVMPVTRMFPDGTILLVSGRPGIYLRVSQDPMAEEWSAPLHVIEVPPEDVYERYYYYTCSNTGLAITGERTALLAYADFTLDAPNGERAKSILVRKITVEG